MATSAGGAGQTWITAAPPPRPQQAQASAAHTDPLGYLVAVLGALAGGVVLSIAGGYAGAAYGQATAPDGWAALGYALLGLAVGAWIGAAAGCWVLLRITQQGRALATGLLTMVMLPLAAAAGAWIDGGVSWLMVAFALASALPARLLATAIGRSA